MKSRFLSTLSTIMISFIILFVFKGCKKTENPIKYPKGTFPDSVYNLSGLNTVWDDYNSNIYVLYGRLPIIFSTNRGSSGGQFDLISGSFEYFFDQGTGFFDVSGDMETTPFYSALATKASSSGNEFGPYSIFSSTDGYEYFLFSSGPSADGQDLYYIKYLPPYGTNIPDLLGPFPVTLLNTAESEAYISFDMNEDSAYFCSNRGGNYDIYLHQRTAGQTLETWFNKSFEASVSADSINSSYQDKCPFVYKNIMVFASDREGGMGGFDLYYSIFRKGKWSSPVNFGPGINTSSDEYRPLVGYHPDFTNNMMIFSSNRPGGAGGFDLYFTGFNFPR